MSDATTIKKDLNYYTEHPEEFPTDPEAAAKLLKELDVEALDEVGVQATTEAKPEQKPAEKPGEKKPGEETKVEEKAAPASSAKPAAAAEQKPDGVLTKDGKHVIPYAEMERRLNEAHSSTEAEAAARKEAEKVAKELEGKLTAALAETATLKAGAKPASAQEAVVEIPADVMETLRADFPTQAKAIDALQAGLKATLADNKKMREELDSRIQVHDRDRSESVKSEVESLIDQNADLKDWRANKPLVWNAALDVEDAILSDKKFLSEHLAQTGVDLATDDKARYEVVVARTKRELGLPATASPDGEQKKDLTREADEKVRAAEPAAPRSLSDIRGGDAAGKTLEENLDNVPATELAGRLMAMSEDQRQKWLERVS